MKKIDVGTLVSSIYSLLKDVTAEESAKVLKSVATLLGSSSVSPEASFSNNTHSVHQQGELGRPLTKKNAKAYFDEKKPKTKGEELAVAAKFRSEQQLGDIHTREDLKDVIKSQARRSFDEKNFARDMDNAIRQAKFFMAGDEKGQYILKDVGEKYVEALPDRTAAAETRTASKSPSRKTSKKVAKKTSKK
jgi:hypothetical protein